MDKRGLFWNLLFLLIAVLIVIGAIVYFTGSFRFRTGKVSVNIGYDEENSGEEIIEVGQLPRENSDTAANDDETLIFTNVSSENNKSLNSNNLTE